MEKEDFAEPSDSVALRLGLNSDRSAPNSKPNSNDDQGEADIAKAGPTPNFLNAMLSQLQSVLGELRERGVGVRMFQRDDGLAILLEGAMLCSRHQIIHSATGCPICQ